MNDTILALTLYAMIAFTITLVVYALTMVLGIYSVLLLVVLIALTVASLGRFLKRENVEFSDALPALFITALIFVIVSVVLAFFTSWMIWVAIPALMCTIFLNIPGKEEDEVTKVAKEMIEMSKTIQGEPSSWGNPFVPFTRDITRTIYAFSLSALYICTAMIIIPFSLPMYAPLVIWAVFLVTLILVTRKDGVAVALERIKNLKRK